MSKCFDRREPTLSLRGGQSLYNLGLKGLSDR